MMRVCTFDSAFKCLTREGAEVSQVPSTLAGISREFHFNPLAGVIVRGGEASVGGDD